MNIAREVSLSPSAKTILLHLRRRGTISPMEALITYSLPKVAKQIHELRTAGYPVASVLNQDEAGHRYARYSMYEGEVPLRTPFAEHCIHAKQNQQVYS